MNGWKRSQLQSRSRWWVGAALLFCCSGATHAQKATLLRTVQSEDGLGAVRFSHDGRRVAFFVSGGDPRFTGRILIWDGTGAHKQTLTRNLGEFGGFDLSPTGEVIALGYLNKIKLLDARTGQVRRVLMKPVGDLTQIAFSPDGSTLAVKNKQDAVRLWNIRTGQVSPFGLSKSEIEPNEFVFSPDGRRLAVPNDPDTVQLRDLRTRRVVRTLRHVDGPIAFSRNGRVLATAGGGRNDPAIKIWDIKTGALKRTLKGAVPPGGDQAFHAHKLALSPNGRLLAAYFGGGGDWGECRLWDLATGRYRTLDADGDGGIAFSSDGRRLMVGSWDGRVYYFRVSP